MAVVPILEFQKSLITALRADTTLVAKLQSAQSITDNIPQELPYPYVQLGELTSNDYGADDTDMLDHTVTFHIWSRNPGKKEMKGIMDDIRRILHNNLLPVTGAVVVVLRIDYENDLLDPDGFTNHGVQRFRALIQGGS